MGLPFEPAWLVVGLAVFLIGLTKSGFGAGVGLIVPPMTALAMSHTSAGEKAALGLLLPLLIAGDLIAVGQYWREFRLVNVRRLLLSSVTGVALGGVALWGLYSLGKRQVELANALIRLEIGIECAILVGLHWYRLRRGSGARLMGEPWRSWVTGNFIGVSSSLAHAAGPIFALYIVPLGLTRQAFVAAGAVYFAMVNMAKLPAYYLSGQFEGIRLGSTLGWLPLVILGALAGRMVIKRVSDALFLKWVYASTFVLGLYLIGDAAWRLAHLS
jgi:uncharacterized protein